MAIKIHTGGKTEYGNGEKSVRGADSLSTSFDWRYFLQGLDKVRFLGGKEGTRVNDSVCYNCVLRVSVRGEGSTYFIQGFEYVLEGHSESSYPSHDDDTQRNI